MGTNPSPVKHSRVHASWAACTADAAMLRWPRLAERWRYEVGVVLLGIAQVWQQTGDPRYF
ncbi:MAG: hypothetical protein ACP5UQ_13935 [Anaerolineae bacterium]